MNNINNHQAQDYFGDVDILKGIAIFLVYLGHSILVYPVNLHSIPLWDRVFRLVESVHMPMFFLLSGFCFSYAAPYGKYIKKKFFRVVVPYLFFAPLNLAIKLLFPSLVNDSGDLLSGIIDILFYGDGYWFLYCAFLIYLTFPLFDRLYGKLPLTYIAILPILFALSMRTEITVFLTFRLFFHYLPYFVVGYLLRRTAGSTLKAMTEKTDEGGKTKPLEKNETALMTVSEGKRASNSTMYDLNRSSVLESMKGRSMLWAIPGALLACIWVYIVEIIGGSVFVTGYIIAALTGIAVFFFLVRAGVFDGISKILILMGKYTLPLYIINGYLLVISRTLVCGVLGIEEPLLIVVLNCFSNMAAGMFIVHFIVMKVPVFKFIFGMGGTGNGSGAIHNG